MPPNPISMVPGVTGPTPISPTSSATPAASASQTGPSTELSPPWSWTFSRRSIKSVGEMRRVTRPGGVVASGVFDFWGGYSAFSLVWDTASVLDEGIRALRDHLKAHPLVRPNGQAELWRRIGLTEVIEVPIVISFDYSSFDDYWSNFTTGQGRLGSHLKGLPGEVRDSIQQHVRAGYLGGLSDGPRAFAIIVRAVRGLAPG